MRDWSSDVCSSDLAPARRVPAQAAQGHDESRIRAHQDPIGPGPGRPAEALPYGKGDQGYSPRTIAYYRTTLAHMTQALAKPYTQVTSDDLRAYLAEYKILN